MQLKIGIKIRELRHRDGRTQDALAEALGITAQAVSRWEAGGSYPDMEIIPAIANYFHISIDELFGYHYDRESKIDAIVNRIDSFGIAYRGDDEWVDECLSILREGLAEFPQNERLLITLADTLSAAGWRRHKEWQYYDEEGFMRHNYDAHKKNEYWTESIKICEYLVDNAADNETFTRANQILVLLYQNMGKTEKAISRAQKMSELEYCRENLLVVATDGKEHAKYLGQVLLALIGEFTGKLMQALMSNKQHYESDMPIEKIKGLISVYDLIFDDGNMGIYHDELIRLYLYLSRVQWERGYHDDAFVSLHKSLKHAKALEAVCDGKAHTFTAPLVSFVTYETRTSEKIAKALPDDWPFYCMPNCSQIAKEIKSDPRWDEWVAKTQE